jgi:hypothetical protein
MQNLQNYELSTVFYIVSTATILESQQSKKKALPALKYDKGRPV